MTDKNRNFSLEEEYFVKLGIFLIADIFIFLMLIASQVLAVCTGLYDFSLALKVTKTVSLILLGLFILQSLLIITCAIVDTVWKDSHTKKDECIAEKEVYL